MAIERQGGALDMRPTLFRYKEQKMERIRKAAKATSVIVIAILTALVVTALCSPEEDWTELAEMMESLDGQSDLERQIDWDNLPKEVVAWVEVPGTSIDEPIVQASPNSPDAYLYKDVFGEGAYGTPYIDCECSIDSRFVMVYGHHMSDGSVFAGFASFIDEGYAQEHDEIIVYKRSGEILNLKPIAVNIVYNFSREIRQFSIFISTDLRRDATSVSWSITRLSWLALTIFTAMGLRLRISPERL